MTSAVIGVVLAQMTLLIGGHECMSEGGARTGLGIGIGVESAPRSGGTGGCRKPSSVT